MKKMSAVLLAAVIFVFPIIALASNQCIPQLVSANGREYTVSLDVPDLKSEYPVNLDDYEMNALEYGWGFSFTDDSHLYEISTLHFKSGEPETISIQNMQTSLWIVGESSASLIDFADLNVNGTKLVWKFTVPAEADLSKLQIIHAFVQTPMECYSSDVVIDISASEAEPINPNNSILKQDSDGKWRYYENGSFVEKTGVVEFSGGRFFVADGVLCSDANGLAEYGGQWYFLAGGQVQAQHTGLAEYGGEWFYVNNGILDITRAGIVTYDGAKFMLGTGRILKEANGLIQDPNTGTWYFVSAGQVASNYRGLALYDGHWFYVWDGVFQSNAEGYVEHDGATFYVVGGMVQ